MSGVRTVLALSKALTTGPSTAIVTCRSQSGGYRELGQRCWCPPARGGRFWEHKRNACSLRVMGGSRHPPTAGGSVLV